MAAGSLFSPLIDWAQQDLTNWAGNLAYGTSRLKRVSSVEEARPWIKAQTRFKVLGTRHCFNDIADSRDEFLSLEPMRKVVALHANTVTVEAGIRYGELAVYLNDRGFALHNLASLPHISVAGGCATATHGSGVHNANLSSAVAGMELLTASGDLRQLSGEELQAATVHLGALGVVTHLTLAIQPTYQVRQYVYENMPMSALEQHFGEIMTAGYSVSLFTDWKNRNINEVWIKCRDAFAAPPEFFGATAATRNLHPIHDISADNCTPQMGVPGPWHERLPHFKMGFTPSSGKELQTEYFVPLEHAYEAIKAVEQLHEQVSPHLLISEIRCIAADDFWMSPCFRRPSTTIHFTWKPEWEAVRQLLPLIEAQLAPFHARPHWGKLFAMDKTKLEALYPKMKDFRELVRSYDPGGKFRNAWLERLIV
ncbi:xylitol oxidase [Dinghuibacter silviterrae]|uniref:Xylitol oxidase n=2 Tax=Dinghuibacter silviterrae TaxID=1539049 RepID=A0A4R8DF18_9BACT|nr:xylitol oxidase [Dinghuibacter silviterrae]